MALLTFLTTQIFFSMPSEPIVRSESCRVKRTQTGPFCFPFLGVKFLKRGNNFCGRHGADIARPVSAVAESVRRIESANLYGDGIERHRAQTRTPFLHSPERCFSRVAVGSRPRDGAGDRWPPDTPPARSTTPLRACSTAAADHFLRRRADVFGSDVFKTSSVYGYDARLKPLLVAVRHQSAQLRLLPSLRPVARKSVPGTPM